MFSLQYHLSTGAVFEGKHQCKQFGFSFSLRQTKKFLPPALRQFFTFFTVCKNAILQLAIFFRSLPTFLHFHIPCFSKAGIL